MKDLLRVALALVLAVSVTRADAAAKWSAGVKGGVNLADLSGPYLVEGFESSTRTGFIGGAFVAADLSEALSLRVEGLYAMKGAEFEGDFSGTDMLDYVEFPVLLVANVPAGEKFKFSLFAGPTFGFNVNAETEYQSEFQGAGATTVDISDRIKDFEFGAAFGAGGEFVMDSFSIIIDARYSRGVTSVFEDVNGESSDVDNTGIGVMAGVAFPLGAK